MQIIITQLIVVLINYYIANTENKFGIYFVTFLFNLANLIMYAVNDDRTTAILYIVITVRSLVYIFKDKLKKWHIIPILAVAAQLYVGFTTIENLWQLIPIFTPCIVCIYMWYGQTTQQLRIGNIVCNGLWGIYNFRTSLYIVALSRLITVIANVRAYIKHFNDTKKVESC